MERTVPSRGSDEISLYLRTYYSLLRSTREVQIATLTESHMRIHSALHVGVDKSEPDMAAFIYVILRIPACIAHCRLVVMGQSEQVFIENGYPEVESWESVQSLGRRRRNFWNGKETLAVYIASRSDIDDLIPSLTAYQIERRKLHDLMSGNPTIQLLEPYRGVDVPDEILEDISSETGIMFNDLERLRTIWQDEFTTNLLTISRVKQSLSVRLLAGSLADYRRATRKWWLNVGRYVPDIAFEEHPIYFVSSNTHSMTNLLSGFALEKENELVEFIESNVSENLRNEYYDILERNVPSSRENFLYYALKKFETTFPSRRAERIEREQAVGIRRAPSEHVFDVEVQVIRLRQLEKRYLDPRLQLPGVENLRMSRALVVNIDFPLGMAAYQVLSEIARNIAEIRGIFIMGKAATLNGRIGDVMIPNVVHDEQSLNTYIFDNCFSADDVASHLVYGTVMDNQKAISALGTFLQNDSYMEVFYREGYTVIEMESGPYMSSIYELVRPQRHPRNELVNLQNAPFPIGILHYASDTPFSKGKNLGSQNLSYFGMDPTYATMVAILRQIFAKEISETN